MGDIKDYREKELKMYVLACILILISLTKGYSVQMEDGKRIVAITEVLDTALVSSCLYIFVFISDAMFTSRVKDKIVSLFGLIKKPAYTIFTDIEESDKDDRFSKKEALREYKDIYANMPEGKKLTYFYQNEKWYKIYSRNRDVAMIYSSNREYLLCRDMFFSTISLAVMYALSILVHFFKFNLTYVVFLAVMLLLNFFATHIKAKRFVYNVIAYDLSERDKEKKGTSI